MWPDFHYGKSKLPKPWQNKMGERRKKRKKNKTKEKGRRKKTIGSYEYADEGTAAPPCSQAPWKENRASS